MSYEWQWVVSTVRYLLVLVAGSIVSCALAGHFHVRLRLVSHSISANRSIRRRSDDDFTFLHCTFFAHRQLDSTDCSINWMVYLVCSSCALPFRQAATTVLLLSLLCMCLFTSIVVMIVIVSTLPWLALYFNYLVFQSLFLTVWTVWRVNNQFSAHTRAEPPSARAEGGNYTQKCRCRRNDGGENEAKQKRCWCRWSVSDELQAYDTLSRVVVLAGVCLAVGFTSANCCEQTWYVCERKKDYEEILTPIVYNEAHVTSLNKRSAV